MLKKRNLRLPAVVISVAVMALIVCFSSQHGVESHDLSKGIAARILALLQGAFPGLTLDELNRFLRKLAHFTLYFILGCSLTGVFSRQRRVPSVLPAILAGACFAASDELHQMFSDGRSASAWDVLLDTCGVTAGSLLTYGLVKLRRRRGGN